MSFNKKANCYSQARTDRDLFGMVYGDLKDAGFEDEDLSDYDALADKLEEEGADEYIVDCLRDAAEMEATLKVREKRAAFRNKSSGIVERKGKYLVTDSEGNVLPSNPKGERGSVGHERKADAVKQLAAIESSKARHEKSAFRVKGPAEGPINDIDTLLNEVHLEFNDRDDNFFSFTEIGKKAVVKHAVSEAVERVIGYEFHPETAHHISTLLVNDENINYRKYFGKSLDILDLLAEANEEDIEFDEKVEELHTTFSEEAEEFLEDKLDDEPLTTLHWLCQDYGHSVFAGTYGQDFQKEFKALVKKGSLEVDWKGINEELDFWKA